MAIPNFPGITPGFQNYVRKQLAERDKKIADLEQRMIEVERYRDTQAAPKRRTRAKKDAE